MLLSLGFCFFVLEITERNIGVQGLILKFQSKSQLGPNQMYSLHPRNEDCVL